MKWTDSLASHALGRLATAIAVAALLVACGAGPEPSPTGSSTTASQRPSAAQSVEVPSASPSPLASLDPSQAPNPSFMVGQLARDTIAQVVTTDLVVRSRPGVAVGSEIYPERLNWPTLIFILDGPVAADGYDWYLVDPFSPRVCVDVCDELPPFGWVAQAAKDGEPWIAPGAIECPSPTTDSIRWLSRVARLACFADETLTLDGTMDGCFSSETPVAWKQTGCVLRPRNHVPSDTFDVSLGVYASTGVQFPAAGTDVRVTGHFDDPAAASCAVLASPSPDFGVQPVPAELAVLWCRGDFMVTNIEIH